MEMIVKAKETMSARERVRKTFAFEKTDRVTIGYDSNPVIRGKLMNAMGISCGDPDAELLLRKKLGVDYMGVIPGYTGKPLYPDIPGRKRNGHNGAVMRRVENEFGYYMDFCDFPLQDVEDEIMAAYPFPDPDDFDYEKASAQIARLHALDFAVYIGNPGYGDILNTTGMLMGVENALVNLLSEDEATLEMTDRRLDADLKILERMLEKNPGEIDFLWLGEDLGTQLTPMISMEMYQKVLQPRHQKFIDLASAYDIPVQIHTCGSSSWVYETWIKMGVTGVDTLQPEAANMEPAYLARHFGGRLTFRGCISTAGPLAYGTAEETAQVCRETLETLMPWGGYHFAPTHAIQDNTPVENIIAMYQTAHDCGCY